MAIVSDEQVIKVLRQYNPWWRNPLAIKEENKPQKRLAYYEALRMISHKTIRRFAVLSGARRVGKTTIMYQMMNSLIDEGVNPKNILYVSFDNPIVKLVNVETVLSIYESLYPIEGTRYIFLDEIQYTEHWELWMKVIYDSRKDIRLTATGSASPILEKGSTDSGTGRWSILKIPTMSFYEYCRLLQIEEPILPNNLRLTKLIKMSKAELGDLMDRFAPLEVHFNRYLMIGGFPELVLSDDDMYAQRMLREDVVDKVIKRDVLTLFNIRSPLLMEKLFLYLCMNSTEIFSVTRAGRSGRCKPYVLPAVIDDLHPKLPMLGILNFIEKNISCSLNGIKGLIDGKDCLHIDKLYNRIVEGYIQDIFGVYTLVNQAVHHLIHDRRLADTPCAG